MRKFIKGCLGVAAALIAAHFALAEVNAGVFSECSPCGEVSCDPCEPVCGKKSPYFWGAWIESGLWANQYGQRDVYNAAGNWQGRSGNTAALQNVRMTGVQMNQTVLYFGKKVDHHKRFDIGGRMDVMFGTDAMMLQSRGLEMASAYDANQWGNWQTGDYGTAIPQAYAEFGFGKLSVKVGKMLSKLSEESPYSTERFFYSLSDTYAIAPHTHSGIVAEYEFNEKLSGFVGWVQGYRMTAGNDMGQPESAMFFDSSKNNAFYGGFDYHVTKRLSLAYALLLGENTERLGISGRHEMFVQSFAAKFVGKKWDYTFEWVLRNDNFYENNANSYYNNWIGNYGITQELIYKVNKKWAVGGRFDWGNGYDIGYSPTGVRTAFVSGPEIEHTSVSLAANWTPNKWLIVKPEIRHDHFTEERPFNLVNGPSKRDQLSGGMSVIVKR